MRIPLVAAGLFAALAAAPAAAEVVDAQANGFAVKETVIIAAPPEKVFDAIGRLGQWWDSAHTYSGNAPANITLEVKPGGCWCEKTPTGGVEHMRVVYIDRAKAMRLQGALGPLQNSGALGHLSFNLIPKDGGTQLVLAYDVGGYFPGGFKPIAPAVDGVLNTAAQRLKRYVETGKPG